MADPPSPVGRAVSPDAERMLGTKLPVLGHGFVVLVDYMGNDAAIVQAARVSYGVGTKSVRDDRGLIRYLMRHRHTTPFEMVELKFLVRLPIYVARQWIRHRTACLAEGTRLQLDRGGSGPAGPALSVPVEQLWERLRPVTADGTRSAGDGAVDGSRLVGPGVRQLREDRGTFGHGRVVRVFRNGVKPVFRVVLADGRSIDCTSNHRFLFADGWGTLEEKAGLREVNGRAVWAPGAYALTVNGTEQRRPALYRDRAWLARTLRRPGGSVAGVAAECGVSPATVRRWAGPGAGAGRPRRSGVGSNAVTVPRRVPVDRFEFLGPRMTYDVEVAGPFHNVVANGFVSHNSVNEYSARYSVVPDEYDVPAPDEVRHQSTRNRQGRGEPLAAEVVERFRTDLESVSKEAYAAYQRAIDAGVARETARLLLPVAYYTQWYWKINLWNLFHFLSLRLDPHAQDEIRLYAAELAKAARAVAPVAYEAFEDFQLRGLSLGRNERAAVRLLLEGKSPPEACEAAGLPLVRPDGKPMTTGEGVEFLEKLERLRSAD